MRCDMKGGSGSHQRWPVAAAHRRAGGAAGRSGCTHAGRGHTPSPSPGHSCLWELMALQAGPRGRPEAPSTAGRQSGQLAGQQGPWIAASTDPELGEQLERCTGAMGWHPQSGGGSARSAAKPICGPVRCPCCSTTARSLSPTRSGLLGPSTRPRGGMATALCSGLGFRAALAPPGRSYGFAGGYRHQPAAFALPSKAAFQERVLTLLSSPLLTL